MFAPEHELFRATVRDFNRVAYDAVQIFGGYGYMREFPVERFYRDATLDIMRRAYARVVSAGKIIDTVSRW